MHFLRKFYVFSELKLNTITTVRMFPPQEFTYGLHILILTSITIYYFYMHLFYEFTFKDLNDWLRRS